MTTLAQQQQALLQALFDWPSDNAIKKLACYAINTGGRGLKCYQSNGHALAQRALAAAYPVLVQMLGEDSFSNLARALWHAYPPEHGDAARWGGNLCDFIAEAPQLSEYPYLADVSRCEWLLHRAAFAGDAQPDHSTLALLTSSDPATVGLALSAATASVESRWPVATLIAAHTQQDFSLAHAAAEVRRGVAQSVVVWRQGLRPRLREALPGEVKLVSCLQQGYSLLAALDAAPALDFAQWLPLAVHSGLVLCAQPLTAA
jgi:hypothetical protein